MSINGLHKFHGDSTLWKKLYMYFWIFGSKILIFQYYFLWTFWKEFRFPAMFPITYTSISRHGHKRSTGVPVYTCLFLCAFCKPALPDGASARLLLQAFAWGETISRTKLVIFCFLFPCCGGDYFKSDASIISQLWILENPLLLKLL